MSSIYRLTGIILNRKNIGSVDRKITLFAADGKHELRARGTQKLESKLAGSLEPLTLVEVTVAKGKTMDQIIGSTIRDSYRTIHSNLVRIAAAGLIASAVDVLVSGRLDETISYRRIREAFVLLGRSKTNREVYLTVSYGLWNLLSVLGHMPRTTDLSVRPPVRRLITILLLGKPNLVRRIKSLVTTARASTEVAVGEIERAAERPLPATPFFRGPSRVLSLMV